MVISLAHYFLLLHKKHTIMRASLSYYVNTNVVKLTYCMKFPH
jgi:hypothetical protein